MCRVDFPSIRPFMACGSNPWSRAKLARPSLPTTIGIYYSERESSCSVGTRPCGVNLSTTSGNTWLRPAISSSRDIPVCVMSVSI